jgi:hypothetical protein
MSKGHPVEEANKEAAESTEQLVSIFIKSNGISTEPRKDEKGRTRRYLKGEISGTKLVNGVERHFLEKFEVECDRQIEVSPMIAEALKPLCLDTDD